MLEARIRQARRAEFEAGATESERGWLILGRRVGSQDLVKEIEARIRRRHELGLDAVDCAADPPTDDCTCLSEALDKVGNGSRLTILRAAKRAHAAHLASRPKPLPVPEPEPDAEPAYTQVTTPLPEPDPARFDRDISDEKPRVVKHFRRWYDEPAGAGILSKRF